MKQEELQNLFLPFLPSKEGYSQAADLLDCREKNPAEDEWVPAIVEVYYKQEPNTDDDIDKFLKQKSISLIEGAHLLMGMKLNSIAASVMSKPVLHIYQMAIKDIRENKLKTEHIDAEEFWENHVFNDEITFHSGDQNISVCIKGTKHGIAHHFQSHVFIDWALSTGLLIDEKLLQMIGVSPVAKCYDHNKVEALFLPTNYPILATSTLPTKNELNDLSILSIAQVLWYTTPDMTIEQMPENTLIKRYLPYEGYSNRHVFRNKVKIIDPRIKKSRSKKSSSVSKRAPDTPKIIPGVVINNGNDQVIWDFSKLKVVCKTLLMTLLQINSSLNEEQLLNHDLIQIYVKNLHPLIGLMVRDWIHESKKWSLQVVVGNSNKKNITPQSHKVK